MSLEIDIRFWWGDRVPSVSEHFTKLATVIEGWLGDGMTWTRASLRKGTPGNLLASASPIRSLEQILAMIPDKSDDCKLTAYASMPCWRFEGGKAVRGAVPIALSVWGPTYGQAIGHHIQDEGDAQISILNAGPFYGVLSQDGEQFEDLEVNARVEENLYALLELLQSVTIQAKPIHWLVFSDEGAPLSILHAHATWFDNSEVALAAVLRFQSHLRTGYAPFRMPPIASVNQLEGSGYGHKFRSTGQNTALLNRLVPAAGKTADLQTLQQARELGKYDSLDLDPGFILLNLPFFMNAFLDEFVLDALGA